MTQLGCVRILATPEVSRNHFTVRSAAIALRNFAVDSESAFWANDIDVLGLDFLATTKYIQGPRQLTDRYLLALAAANGGTLATFDRSIGASLPATSPLLAHLELIPS